MKRTKKYGWIILLAASLITGTIENTVAAEEKIFQNYGVITFGMNQPTGDLDDSGYDAGVATGVVYGRYLGKHVVFEGGLNSFVTEQDLTGNTAIAGDYTREDKIGVTALLMTLKGEYPVGSVRLFAGAGFGYYLLNFDTEVETQLLGTFDADDTDEVFGTHVAAGAHYDFTKHIFAGVEGLYRWTGDVKIRKNAATVPVELESDLDGYAVSFLAGYRF